MPLLIPTNNEDMDSFIKRFMSDEKMIAEYPDEKQRMLIALVQWESVDKYNASNIDNGYWMCSNVQLQPTENEQIIKVFPKGTYYIHKYNKDIEFNDKFYNEIATAFSSESLSKPKIDKDHEFKSSFGDILNYQIKNDGMYFNIKLNPKGVELVKSGEYNYISPAWGKTKDTGNVEFPNRLLAVSLVNFPALEGALPALRDQLRLSKFEVVQEKVKEAKMELYILANELGLNKEASIEAVHAEIKTLKTKVSGYEADNKELSAKCKTAEDTAIQLSQKIKDIETASLKTEAVEFVRKQIELGKIHPAIQEIVISRYCLNKEDVINEMGLIPEKVYNGRMANNTDTTGLSKDQSDKMLKAGLDPTNKEDVTIFLARQRG